MNKATRSQKAAQFNRVPRLGSPAMLVPAALLTSSVVLVSGCETVVDPTVLTGIDVLVRDDFEPLRDKRVGLITNQTGVDRDGVSTIDRLDRAGAVELVALFSPEHGIRGAAEAGEAVADTIDAVTGLRVFSLYGATREPPPPTLDGLDALVFDIQGVGSRYYTYQWTMALAMRAAAEAGIEFVVLDRPNPIGGVVQGNVLDPAFSTFVGLYPVAMRHGLTAGELAGLLAGRFSLGPAPTVVPLDGWERRMRFDQTGLDWIAPSPNMPTPITALHYAGLCLFEGTNLSVGRGTERPFEQIGAPWLDAPALVEWLGTQHLAGVTFSTVSFTPDNPDDGKYANRTVQGVRFTATDRERYDPTRTAVAALTGIRLLHPERLEWQSAHFDRLAGTDRLRMAIDAGLDWREVVDGWDEEEAQFRALSRRYLLYE